MRVTKLAAVTVIAAGIATGSISMAASSAQAATTAPASTAQRTQVVTARAATPAVTKRNIYESEDGCEIAGNWGYVWGAWTFWWCVPRSVPGDDGTWWQLYTVP
jgi:hypothetical protein